MSKVSNQTKPNVFVYTSYRDFLRDYYDYAKRESSFFSYRYFSSKAGFKSTNILKLVISGERNISKKSIPKFAKGLNLSSSEAQFFEYLVCYCQSGTMDEKSKWYEMMMASKSMTQLFPLKKAQFNYYKNWFYLPIRELIAQRGFKEDLEWIQQQLIWPVSTDEIDTAIKDMLALELIRRDSLGQLELTHKSITTKDEVLSLMVANYHRDMLGLAADSIERVPREKRDISALCLPVSEKISAKIKSRIQEFRKELLKMAEEDSGESKVIQINIQMFPLTKGEG